MMISQNRDNVCCFQRRLFDKPREVFWIPIKGGSTKNMSLTFNAEILNPHEIVRRLIHGFTHREADFCQRNIEGSYNVYIPHTIAAEHGEQQSCIDIGVLTIEAESFDETCRTVPQSRHCNIDPFRCFI